MSSSIGSKILRTAQVARPAEILASSFHTSSVCLIGRRNNAKTPTRRRLAEPLEISRPNRVERKARETRPKVGAKEKNKREAFVRENVPHSEAKDTLEASTSRAPPPRRRKESEARGTWTAADKLALPAPAEPPTDSPTEHRSSYDRPQDFDTLVADDFERSVRSEPVKGLPSEFTSPPLMPGLVDSIVDVLGPHVTPTPIQGLAIKHVLYPWKTKEEAETMPWREFLLASETGSGKSIAYMLPMLQDLKASELASAEADDAAETKDSKRAYNPRAIVLAPTHELSRQLSGTAKSLLHNIKLRVLCASRANVSSRQNVTASKMSAMFEDLDGVSGTHAPKARPIDVLVGTPNKVLEMIRGHGWDWEVRKRSEENADERHPRKPFVVGHPELGLRRVEWVIVDEADVLFDTDFQERTRLLLSDIARARRQSEPKVIESTSESSTSTAPAPAQYPFNLILTSATIPTSLANYLDKHHPRLKRLVSPRLHHLPSTLRTEHVAWTSGNKNADVEARIKRIWWADAHQQQGGHRSRVLVFCNKSAKVEELGRYLAANGVPNVALTSTAEARQRGNNHHLDGFMTKPASSTKDKTEAADEKEDENAPRVLITTSLLSRGLDFSPDIKNVLIVDTPRNMIDFLHRAGRTARAGQQGTVIVFGKAQGLRQNEHERVPQSRRAPREGRSQKCSGERDPGNQALSPTSTSTSNTTSLKNMARRAAPPGAGPAFYSGAPHRAYLPDPDESTFSRFMREEIFSPEKLPGNIGIVTGVAMFFGGIVAIRTWGDLMIPA
ncbi:hypothetical protein EIP86_007245 [Pleurotus ostreatoroseus]|nr:hypothetical protein EIP86_007245 [Pleurotus ostreatoroseus]